MNFMTFTYTKDADKVSSRSFYPVVSPNTMYEGIDISELDADEQVSFVIEMEVAKAEFLDECNRIQAEYDVTTNYRRFNPSKMTDVLNEDL